MNEHLRTDQDGTVTLGSPGVVGTNGLTLAGDAGKALSGAVRSGRLSLPDKGDDPNQDAHGNEVDHPQEQVWYTNDPHKNPNSYIAVSYESGQVVVRDGNDPTGKAAKFTYDQWRAICGQDTDDTSKRAGGDKGIAADKPMEAPTGGGSGGAAKAQTRAARGR